MNEIIEKFKEYYNNKRKLQAVKDFKELSNLGLKESKDFIDNNWNENLGDHVVNYLNLSTDNKLELLRCQDIVYFYRNYVTISDGKTKRKPNQREIDLMIQIKKAQDEGKPIIYYSKTKRFKI